MTRASPIQFTRTCRGFTLIEVVLAASLGSIVMVAALGVYGMLTRTDRVLEHRAAQTNDLGLLRTVMRRSFESIVTSDEKKPASGREVGKRGEEANQAANKAEAGRELSASDEDALKNRPRISLLADASGANAGVFRRAKMAGASWGSGPQRLEVVVSKPPISPDAIRAMHPRMAQVAYQQQLAAQRDISGELPPMHRLPMRSVFELRPDFATRYNDGRSRGSADGWTLWWRPLPSDPTVPVPADPTQDMEAVPLASGLVSCHWRVFQKGEYKDQYEAIYWNDLPGYIEMEVQTADNLTADWLFEIEWSNAKEPSSEDESGDIDGEGSEAGSNGSAAGGLVRNGSAAGRTGGGRTAGPRAPSAGPGRANPVRQPSRSGGPQRTGEGTSNPRGGGGGGGGRR